MSEKDDLITGGTQETSSAAETAEATSSVVVNDAAEAASSAIEGDAAEECAEASGPESYVVTAEGVPVGGTAYRRGNAILNFIKSVLGLGQKGDMVPGGEKISYYTYFAGQNLIYALVSMFLTTFAVMQGMDPEKVAVVMLAVKIWDAVNDAFFGTLFDKIKFKSGNKFMPWLKMSVVLIPLSVIFMFAMPADIPEIAHADQCFHRDG